MFLIICGVLFFSVFRTSCEGLPLPETEVDEPNNEEAKAVVRAEAKPPGSGALTSALQTGVSTILNSSNMKEAKLVMGGFSFAIIPGPDLQQLGQLNPGMLSQLLSSFPGKK